MAASMKSVCFEIRQFFVLSRCIRTVCNGNRSNILQNRNYHNQLYLHHTGKLNIYNCRYFSSGQCCGSMNESKGPRTANNTSRSKAFSTSLAARYADEDEHSELVEKINTNIEHNSTGRLFAVVQLQGKQRKVTTNDLVLMKYHLEADIGEKILLNKVLLMGSKDFTVIGRPMLSPKQARVEAMVIEKTLTPTQISFLYKKRKSWKRMWLKKFSLTVLRITDIQISSVGDE